jgi:hypothetical protein
MAVDGVLVLNAWTRSVVLGMMRFRFFSDAPATRGRGI